MAADTRQRMIEAAADLLQRGGMEAASFTDVLASSGAARGAIYHHFPEGKHELTREAVAWTGRRVLGNLDALAGSTPAEVTAAFLDRIRPIVADASIGRSCAVAAVVVETGQRDDELTHVAGAALQSWIAALRKHLAELGVAPAVAQQVATLLITFLEGTQVLCRAVGGLDPFDDARPIVLASIVAVLTTRSNDDGYAGTTDA